MKYFRSRRVVTDNTTLIFNAGENKSFVYHSDSVNDYIGVDIEDSTAVLLNQHPEIEATELTYEEMKPILEDCRMMRDLDKLIENKIAEKYSMGKELKLRDMDIDEAERIFYEAYKESVKAPVRLIKLEMGLR